jgi:hypothetical protein
MAQSDPRGVEAARRTKCGTEWTSGGRLRNVLGVFGGDVHLVANLTAKSGCATLLLAPRCWLCVVLVFLHEELSVVRNRDNL